MKAWMAPIKVEHHTFACEIHFEEKHKGTIILKHRIMGERIVSFEGPLERPSKPHHMNFCVTGYVEMDYLPDVFARKWLDEWNDAHTEQQI